MTARLFVCLSLAAAAVSAADAPPLERATKVKITTLSTMLADTAGVGEWGFCALLEVDGRKLLIDTGGRPDTVLKNARELGVDLSDVEEVVLTHNHNDHTGGLLMLRTEWAAKAPKALVRTHVGKGIFLKRGETVGEAVRKNSNTDMTLLRRQYEAAGGTMVEHDRPHRLLPGVWLTGPIPRVHPERNWNPGGRIETDKGPVPDDIPEDQAVVIDTDAGLVVICGCGHAGVINSLEQARKTVRPAKIHAVVGGLHLLSADDAQLAWTAGKLRDFGLEHLLGSHCTGVNAMFTLRTQLGMDKKNAVVGAVGTVFELGRGIAPGKLSR